MTIVCAALVGQQNQPLFLRTYPTAAEGEQLVKLHYIVHCSLDAIEERVIQKRVVETPNSYLGLLYPIQELKVYGYLTNTGLKILLVLDDSSARDDVLSKVMRRIHHAYVDMASNPFFTFGASISCPKFAGVVDGAISSVNKA